MTETTFTVAEDNRTLVVEHMFAAPRSKVWAAWTTPELFAKWWGPRGWSTEVKHMDFQPGGYLLYGMKCEDPRQTDWYGKYSWGKSVYNQIDAEKSFAYTDYFSNENGVETPDMPVMQIQVTFEDVDAGTRVISTSVFESSDALQQVLDMGMEDGLRQTWDRLEELVN